MRLYIIGLWAFALVLPLSAQENGPHATKLTVSPAATPVPVLKHLLIPDLNSQLPGNPVQGYLKCFMEQDNLYANKEILLERQKHLEMTMDEFRKLSPELLASFKTYGGTSAKNARRAARMATLDWNIVAEMQEFGISALLPEVQKLRALADVLSLRIRGEIVAGEYEEAIADITVLLTLSQQLGQHPTYIGTLVGLAIGRIGLNRIEELIQEPKGPNMYWALATLPVPLVKQDEAFRGEMAMFSATIRRLLEPKVVWGEKEIAEAREFVETIGGFAIPTETQRLAIGKWMMARLSDDAWLKTARANLVAMGRDGTMVGKYIPQQVVFLTIYFQAEAERQEYLKYTKLPVAQVIQFLDVKKDLSKMPPEEAVKHIFFGTLSKSRLAQARLDQRIALIRGVEAVRLYTASHQGKLPPNLKETGLPVPIDPASGKEIQYEVKGEQAVITSEPIGPVSQAELAKNWVPRIEVTLRK